MLPALRELTESLSGKPFTVLMALSDGDPDYARRRIAGEGVAWPVLFLPAGILSAEPYRWHVNVWPTIFILDDLGFIRFVEEDDRLLRGRPMDEAVRALLGEMEGGPEKRGDVRRGIELLATPQTDAEYAEGFDLLETALGKYGDFPEIRRVAETWVARANAEGKDRIARGKATLSRLRRDADAVLVRISSAGALMERDAFYEALETLKSLATEAGFRTRLFADLFDRVGDLEATAEGAAYLGVRWDNLYAGEGVRVSAVVAGTAAERDGLEAGDVLLEFDGVALDSPDTLTRLLGGRKPWDRIEFLLRRGGRGEPETVAVVLGRRPE